MNWGLNAPHAEGLNMSAQNDKKYLTWCFIVMWIILVETTK